MIWHINIVSSWLALYIHFVRIVKRIIEVCWYSIVGRDMLRHRAVSVMAAPGLAELFTCPARSSSEMGGSSSSERLNADAHGRLYLRHCRQLPSWRDGRNYACARVIYRRHKHCGYILDIIIVSTVAGIEK